MAPILMAFGYELPVAYVDYSEMSIAYRPSHADATYDFKYGLRAIQGGGRSSARETIGRVAAGALAKKILKMYAGTEILSVGGVVTCIARNVPRGLGCPVFDKLEADLAKAMLSLPATKGFEFGSGFAGTFLTGSEHNDEFYMDELGNMRTRTNRSGGIQKKQKTVTRDRHETELIARGRHDPCVVPRAVPMVEAMVALVLLDQLMAHTAQCGLFPSDPALQQQSVLVAPLRVC
ncbi:Chorismate synthase [Musa troglodytarum]|uniref:chorismate synthase n=1 Tax=Musa troglodytarum TaxID=320322 RepID=A0A9E7EJD8_9LILI|nr:Chorismate synthase [Musa troglodytarum]